MDTGQGRLPQLGVGVSVGGDSVFNEGFLTDRLMKGMLQGGVSIHLIV